MTKADAVELLRLFMRDMHGSADFHFYDKVMPTVEKYAEQFVRPEAKSPASRSRAALPENIRKTLEESNLPVEVATAIADLCDGLIRPEEGECEACAAWNLMCPKCGAPKGGECGWPTNCPTGQNLKSPLPQREEVK